MAVVYEEQNTDISWYSNPITTGTAKDNFHRVIELRKAFCHKLTINKDGTLNKKYFSEQTKDTAMNWNDIELIQLHEGIYKYGVDSVEKWINIQRDFLPRRDFIEVRLKLSQLFGIQDLTVYKDRKFSTEKEILDEFNKNKREAQLNNTWDNKCEISLKKSIAQLTQNDIEKLEENELEHWNKYVYNNPLYVYRVGNKNNKRGKGKGKGKSKGKNKNKNKNKNNNNNKNKNKNKNKNTKKKVSAEKVQKNTIDKMFKKDNGNNGKKSVRFEEVISEKKETENNNNNNNGEEDVDMVDKEVKCVEKKVKKVKKKKGKKVSKRKAKKGVPLLPEDSDDEDMLCVE